LVPFLLYSTLGTLVGGFANLRRILTRENYELVDEYLGPVSKIVLVALIVAFVVCGERKCRRRK